MARKLFERKHISQIALLGGDYRVASLSVYSEKTLRQEYSRMRSILEKRLNSFVRAGTQSSQFYQQYKIERPFLKLKDLEAQKVNEYSDMKRVLTHELSRLYDALALDTSTNAGYQVYMNKRLDSMRKLGIDFINSQQDFAIWEALTKEVQEWGLANLIYGDSEERSGGRKRTSKQLLFSPETTKKLFDLYKKKGSAGIDEFVDNAMWNN